MDRIIRLAATGASTFFGISHGDVASSGMMTATGRIAETGTINVTWQAPSI